MTTTTIALDLDAIKARHFATRDGEWKTTTTQEDTAVVYVDHESIHGAVTVLFEADWGEVADAEFAAQAHQDVPALVAEVERLREENARVINVCVCAPFTPQGEADPFCTAHNPPKKDVNV